MTSRRWWMGRALLGVLAAGATVGCGGVPTSEGPKVFTLDLRSAYPFNGIAGPAVISHNAFLIFPLDVSAELRVASELGPTTAFELQTKSGCGIPDDNAHFNIALHAYELGQGAVPRLAARDVVSVALQMPYRIPQDEFVRVAAAVCVAYRTTASADFVFVPGAVEPTQDPAAEIASAVLPVNQRRVDALAVLFSSTTPVSEVSIETR